MEGELFIIALVVVSMGAAIIADGIAIRDGSPLVDSLKQLGKKDQP